MMSQNKSNRFMPLWLALCVVIGVLVGTFYANHFSGNRLNIINSGSSRLSNLLHIIQMRINMHQEKPIFLRTPLIVKTNVSIIYDFTSNDL